MRAEQAMATPKVSVIIPTCNGANYISEAIQSVLKQSYSNFELLIVNDASPDNTPEIIERFDDSRIKYLVHEKNQGVDRARYTGLNASRGEIIAFLDQDDFFHPDKLQAHVTFLENHPDVGFTYNSRYELNHSDKTIRNLWRPPQDITLADLVLWFPIAPSDWVLRRDWAFRLNISKDYYWTGAEIVYLGRLYLDGCKFGYVDRALNYRWHHSGRIFKDLIGGCESEINCQVKIFDDPRCPADVLSLRDIAHANIYLFWAYRAFAQGETEIGRSFLRKAVQHKPSILSGMPCELVNNFVMNCSEDENLNFSEFLEKVFAQLPQELDQVIGQFNWAIARGYLLKGVRALIWDRFEDGRQYFKRATELGANVDTPFLQQLSKHLVDYEAEYGEQPAQNILKTLNLHLKKIGGRTSVRQLKSLYAINRAFQRFHSGEFNKVPGSILWAIENNPRYLTNHGVIVTFLRSVVAVFKKSIKALAS